MASAFVLRRGACARSTGAALLDRGQTAPRAPGCARRPTTMAAARARRAVTHHHPCSLSSRISARHTCTCPLFLCSRKDPRSGSVTRGDDADGSVDAVCLVVPLAVLGAWAPLCPPPARGWWEAIWWDCALRRVGETNRVSSESASTLSPFAFPGRGCTSLPFSVLFQSVLNLVPPSFSFAAAPLGGPTPPLERAALCVS